MTVKVGDRMPEGTFTVMGESGPELLSTEDLFAGKKVVLFSVEGAFTPTCSARHLPGYVDHADALRAKGVDIIACMAVNDVFVLSAWGQSADAEGRVVMLADGNGEYASALGLELDASRFSMGKRSQRFAIIVDDGDVSALHVEPPGQFGVSAAEALLEPLG